MKWKPFAFLVGVLLVRGALATEAIYTNNSPEYYQVYFSTVSPNPPPTIDARAFLNESTFSVTYNNYNDYPILFQTWNTLNYTNAGGEQMIANAPALTNGAIFYLGEAAFGTGFKFDLHTTNQLPDVMGGTVYNEGQIRCDSILDGNSLYSLGTSGFNFYDVTSIGQFVASATNVINPGSIDVGTGGLISLAGQNVDITGGSLQVEGVLNSVGAFNILGEFATVNFNSVGAVGLDTNGDWNPAVDLSTTYALSSQVPVGPGYVYLTNSQCYLKQEYPYGPLANYRINRFVFLENNSPPNVTAKVYIDNSATLNLGFDVGAAHVEWTGTYIDPATGSPITSYLYLTDDYVLGATTNEFLVNNGVPGNFTFITSPTPLLSNPLAPQPVPAVFPDAGITNYYSVMFANLTSSSYQTNASTVNPSGSITNLPGAIKLSAQNTLNLGFSTITGPNYLALYCTNQFEGSPGASIASPYADIALGVTNGFMVISNLLAANIPTFGGSIQAWSTALSTNVDAQGYTNDNRVLIVFSDFQPTEQPWIQNLYLHGTNSLHISDPLNVYGSLYIDAKSVTLNTNFVGVGANSLYGQLIWLNPQPLNANSAGGAQQIPNLLWLTNNGVIQVSSTANFGNANMPQYASSPGSPAVAATGKLSEQGTNVVLGDKVTIGTNVYTFVKTLTNTVPNEIAWSGTFSISLSNLIAAINGASGSGVKYSSATVANAFVSAGALVNKALTVTARNLDAAVGDAIVTAFTPATAAVRLTWNGNGTLTGGADAIAAGIDFASFVNHSQIGSAGTTIWTTYFENDGTMSNGVGSFVLQSSLAILTNGSTIASGDVALSATNLSAMGVNELIISNHVIQAGRSLTLASTNITDTGVTNGNSWSVGANSGGGTADSGFNTLVAPVAADLGPADESLLGTTVTNIVPNNKTVYNVWAGHDYGVTPAGFTNNLAVGHLVIDVKSTNTQLAYVVSGAGTQNAMYVDLLELKDAATGEANQNPTNHYNFSWLKINTNMVIYYAQALDDGQSVAEALDVASHEGINGGRLRWVYSYAGYFSSTNVVYTNSFGVVVTNAVNAALAQSPDIDSDADGYPNSIDSTKFFEPYEINPMATFTNQPVKSARVEWTTIPNATNIVYYATNLLSTNWLVFTNYQRAYWGANVPFTNRISLTGGFISPQAYISSPPFGAPDNFQQTNVWLYDTVTNVQRYYKVEVWPWVNIP